MVPYRRMRHPNASPPQMRLRFPPALGARPSPPRKGWLPSQEQAPQHTSRSHVHETRETPRREVDLGSFVAAQFDAPSELSARSIRDCPLTNRSLVLPRVDPLPHGTFNVRSGRRPWEFEPSDLLRIFARKPRVNVARTNSSQPDNPVCQLGRLHVSSVALLQRKPLLRNR